MKVGKERLRQYLIHRRNYSTVGQTRRPCYFTENNVDLISAADAVRYKRKHVVVSGGKIFDFILRVLRFEISFNLFPKSGIRFFQNGVICKIDFRFAALSAAFRIFLSVCKSVESKRCAENQNGCRFQCSFHMFLL